MIASSKNTTDTDTLAKIYERAQRLVFEYEKHTSTLTDEDDEAAKQISARLAAEEKLIKEWSPRCIEEAVIMLRHIADEIRQMGGKDEKLPMIRRIVNCLESIAPSAG